MTVIISMMLKPFIVSGFIIAYRILTIAMWKYLPYSVSSFLLKDRRI